MNYTHLHLHTEYSLLDGFNNIKKLSKHLKAIGAHACAITDHGNMYGVLEFYETLKAEGIKPIIGMEAYIHDLPNIEDKPTKRQSPYHLCLYAKNETGYKNLMYLSSMAFIKGFYNRPRINKNILKDHAEGLVCSSACLAGEISRNLNVNSAWAHKTNPQGYDYAKNAVLWFKEVFGDDYYIEIMRHGLKDELSIDDDLIRIAMETNTKIIATNDAHYLTKNEGFDQKLAIKINTARFDDDIDEGDDMSAKIPADERMKKRLLNEFYVKSSEEMLEIFADIPEAVENTNEIADKCNLELKLNNATPPNFKFTRKVANEIGLSLPESENEYSLANDSVLFEKMCRDGLAERLKFIDEAKHGEYKARLEREIETIKNMKFPGYMLIVADFIQYAKKQGIPVGPGRGSAAGSLVSYALKITDLDPLPYNLLFERFLNPERISMPDIDVDFCQDRRGEVIEYVAKRYGEYNVAQVATFGKMLAKAVVRDVARVMEVPYNEANDFAKLIPDELGITLMAHKNKKGEIVDGAYEKEPKIAEEIEKNPLLGKVWKYACELEGLNRNAGTHAAGVVISNEPLWLKTPLWQPTKNKPWQHATQYSKDYLEKVDLIKFDFLGLKTLTVIDNAKKLIKRTYGVDIIWEQINFNDPKTYETIQGGDTLGIFQIESDGMQALAKKLKPDCFEDIIAMLALYRPGPLGCGMVDEFIDIKHGRKEMSFAFESLRPILEPTYGVIVYQEQVMQVVQEIGGFSLGGADLVRRAMSKKKEDEMLKLKTQYLEGAKAKGYDTQKADELFELIMKFAEYGFNKSHSAAYGLVCFQTAYLKTYYPAEFMAALITSESGNIDKVVKYKEEINRMGYAMLAPNINKSYKDFATTKDADGKQAIIYGLAAIKGLGEGVIDSIVAERESRGEFKNFQDFVERNEGIDKKAYEAMIKSGCLDEFKIPRQMLFENIDPILEAARLSKKAKEELKESLFADDLSLQENTLKFPQLKEYPEYSKSQMLGHEKEFIGFYISGHPLDEYKDKLESIAHTTSAHFDECEDGSEILAIATLEKYDMKITKSGNKMHLLSLLDEAGSFELTAFDAYERVENKDEIKNHKPLAYKLKVRHEGDELKLSLIEAYSLEEAKSVKLKKNKITEDEIEANKELFNLPHSVIKDIATAKTQLLLIAKITSFSIKTSKNGNEYAMISITDESGSGEYIAFSSLVPRLNEIKPDTLYGIAINPAKDANSKPSIQEILDSEQIADYQPKKLARPKSENSAYNANMPSSAEAKQAEIKITGEVCVELNLASLNHDIITQIHTLANSQKGDKKLVLSVLDKELGRRLIYRTDYNIPEELAKRIQKLA